MNRIVTLLLLLLACCVAGSGEAAARNRMAVELTTETTSLAPGASVAVALVMEPDEGWHGYWLNPGDAGAAPRVDWRLPPGWSVSPLRFPVPDRLMLFGLANYVYERDHALLATLTAPADAEPETRVPLMARLEYLVCTDEVCVPESATVSAAIRIAPPGPPDPAFAGWRRALPRVLPEPGRFELVTGKLRVAIPLPAVAGVEAPYFFPLTTEAIAHSAPQSVSRSGDWLIVEAEPGARAGTLDLLAGVVEIGPGLGLAFTAAPGSVPAAGTPIEAATASFGGASGILAALFGAIVGGLLLNVMPCVFPILSLKALSLARAGETAGKARAEAVAYAAGVVLTCLLLGGLLLALRATGARLGWAFQLQDPRVILLLMLLVTAIALNLAGLFRLPAIDAGAAAAGVGGRRGAFFTGALAAFVATPCTGPFLGFALGAALVLPVWAALAVFAGLGLGIALPFLALGFIPALRRRLPRPGPWMQSFQRILSLPMFLTALGLAWILGRQAGVDGLTAGLSAALALGLALWWLGSRQPEGRPWLPLAVVAIAAVLPLPFVETVEAAPAQAQGALAAEPFSEMRLAELRASGAPVFVYFTADWCLTCKVNERAALEQQEVVEAFDASGVRVLVGDWTNGDPAIGRFLERHGRSGVPLYLFYPAGREAETLPQILTVGRLTSLGA